MNNHPPGRRDFLKKMTALSAAGVPGVTGLGMGSAYTFNLIKTMSYGDIA